LPEYNEYKKAMKKNILIVLAVIVSFIAFFVSYVQLSWDKVYDAPYPEISASTDPKIIARGKYLVFGPARCATCHVPMDKIVEVDKGLEIPLSGGWELTIPVGTFRAPNITPDKETGIGNLSDKELARTMRYSVGHDGRVNFPFMPFQEMSDEDLTAVISYLRSQEPVKHEVERSEYTFPGKILSAFGLVPPVQPKSPPPESVAIDATIEYGAYLAHSVADCAGCHTKRDQETGEPTGAPSAGGWHLPPDPLSKGYSFVTPNLTPDKETGIMAYWDEAVFINRFRAGRVYEGSPMPWGAFSRMNEVELKAIYRYLKSLDPVSNKIEKVAYAPGEEGPQ